MTVSHDDLSVVALVSGSDPRRHLGVVPSPRSCLSRAIEPGVADPTKAGESHAGDANDDGALSCRRCFSPGSCSARDDAANSSNGSATSSPRPTSSNSCGRSSCAAARPWRITGAAVLAVMGWCCSRWRRPVPGAAGVISERRRLARRFEGGTAGERHGAKTSWTLLTGHRGHFVQVFPRSRR